MEVFFKNLSAEGIETDRLVGDLVALVEETETFLRSPESALAHESREQLLTKLERVKACSGKIREQAAAGARATDRVIRNHPYTSLGLVLLAGIVGGFLVGRKVEARSSQVGRRLKKMLS
ncbi:MAG TPA: hypothetical protein VMZ27_14820 [Candidatus Saccharimonadales bacterium]|nr:hypothetical protein [Candidatus Saccharimonadales bacterium]